MTDEGPALRAEQLERIKQRDGFLNLNVVAVGTVGAISLSSPGRLPAILLIPWATAILGWAYVANDDKVTALGRHLYGVLPTHQQTQSWDAGNKGYLPAAVRRSAEVIVFFLSFVVPTPASILIFARSDSPWADPLLVATVIVGCGLTLALAAGYLLSIVRRPSP